MEFSPLVNSNFCPLMGSLHTHICICAGCYCSFPARRTKAKTKRQQVKSTVIFNTYQRAKDPGCPGPPDPRTPMAIATFTSKRRIPRNESNLGGEVLRQKKVGRNGKPAIPQRKRFGEQTFADISLPGADFCAKSCHKHEHQRQHHHHRHRQTSLLRVTYVRSLSRHKSSCSA